MSTSAVLKAWVAGALIATAMVLGLAVYCLITWDRLSSLYTQLSQQQSLLEIRDRQRSNMAANLEILEENSRPKLIELEDITAAMANLSLQMDAAGLTETYFKMERREVRRERGGVSSINRVMVEGIGEYADAIAYIDELLNGSTYYFIENVMISREGAQVRLRANCIVAGYSDYQYAAIPDVPSEYMYLNPFENEHRIPTGSEE